MMKAKAPTDLELYYEGNYVGRWGGFHVFRYGEKFYTVSDYFTKPIEFNIELMF